MKKFDLPEDINYEEWLEKNKSAVLRSAVAAINPDSMGMERKNALTLAGAMKNCGFTREEFAEVMARSSVDKGTLSKWWDKFTGEGRQGEAGEGTIFAYAQKCGWKWPAPGSVPDGAAAASKPAEKKNNGLNIEVDAEFKFRCIIDSVGYSQKPQNPGEIRSREKVPTPDPAPVSIAEFAVAVAAGRTFYPTVYKKELQETTETGKKKYHYRPVYQQLFVVDIDNEETARDEDNKPIRDENGKEKKIRIKNPLTVDSALQICKKHGIAPFLIYETFSSKYHRDDPFQPYQKFRLCFATDEPVTVEEVGTRGLNQIIEYFIGLFGSAADTATTDPARLIYGTDERDRMQLSGTVIRKSQLVKTVFTRQQPPTDADPEQAEPEQDPQQEEEAVPEWLIVREWQGREIKRIDEPKFAEIFQNEYKVNRINGVFYMDGEDKSDDYILMLIQKKLAAYFKENTGRLTNNVFITLCNSVYTNQPKPDESKIYCRNGITINVKKDGSFDTVSEDLFTLTRLSVNYDKDATCPTFEKYLDELLYEEDIPVLQEYFGYCLIPCTRAQAGLYIKGKGGEGKSVLRDVTMALFGHSAIQEYIHQLGERFTIANLENKLVVIDDDLRTDLLTDTSTIKKLTTAREPFQVERKMKNKYNAYLYSRIFAIGNTFIGSKFDHSDGFYRRQLLIDVKPKTRDEKDDDRFMSDKCISELSGILNWALNGLSRLILNNYHFSISDRMNRTLDGIKHDGDNSLTFIEDDTYILITNDWSDQATTADLFTLYAAWCTDNGDTPIKRKSFQMRMSERFKDFKIRIQTDAGRLQGFAGIRLSAAALTRLQRITERERERIVRLP